MLLAWAGVEQACSHLVNIGLVSQHQEAAGTEARNSHAQEDEQDMKVSARLTPHKYMDMVKLLLYMSL